MSDVDNGVGAVHALLTATHEAPPSGRPPEGALDNPAVWPDFKALGGVRPFDGAVVIGGNIVLWGADRSKRTRWRRRRDSNPRYPCEYAAFRVRCFQPLSHFSAAWSACRRGALDNGCLAGTQGPSQAFMPAFPAFA